MQNDSGILVVNWQLEKGGCEIIFEEIARVLNAKLLGFDEALNALGVQMERRYYRYAILDRCLIFRDFIKQYEKLYDPKLIITNDDCSAFFSELRTPYIVVLQNPYAHLKNLPEFSTLHKYEFVDVYTLLQKLACWNAKMVLPCSKFMQEYGEKFLSLRNMTLLEPGVDMKLFRPMDKDYLREKYGIPEEYEKVGLWIGSFHPISGYHFVPKFVHKYKDIYWILVFKHSIEGRVRAKNVRILTCVKHEQMPEIYNLADFLLNLSFVESFGIKLVEAMACNVPVLTRKVGFLFEYPAEKGAMIISENDLDAVKRFYERKDDFKPRRAVEKRFNIEKFRRSWKNLIKKIF